MSISNMIFASKMYRSSSRKDKIRSAINNPINKELLIQLASYIKDKDEDEPLDTSEENIKDNTSVELEEINTCDTSTSYEADMTGGNVTAATSTANIAAKPEILDTSAVTADLGANESEFNSNTSIDRTVTFVSPSEVAGILNANEDTAGVERAKIKDSELWIYYNDKLNLNNLMTSAIKLLDASSHYQLSFNRLARSENAIVFDVNWNVQQKYVPSIVEEQTSEAK